MKIFISNPVIIDDANRTGPAADEHRRMTKWNCAK